MQATTESPREERPQSDLGKGAYAGSAVLIAVLAALAVLSALGYVAWALRKRRLEREAELAPVSSRGSLRPPPSSRPPAR